MTANSIRYILSVLVIWLVMPVSAWAQEDNPAEEFDPKDPAYQQGYRGPRRDSTRARISTGGNDYVYVDEENVSDDTVATKPLKNPKLAGWLSFALPGAGQVYNGQYWKIPIIYGGIGTLAYVSHFYNTRFRQLKNDEHVLLNDGKSTTGGVSIHGLTNESDIVRYMTKYRRYRDLCFVGMALVYMMNVFDAVVDAHLYDYDVSEDITLHVEPCTMGPVMANQNPSFGARLTIRF